MSDSVHIQIKMDSEEWEIIEQAREQHPQYKHMTMDETIRELLQQEFQE